MIASKASGAYCVTGSKHIGAGIDVIEPRETRPRAVRALRMLENKVDTMLRKKHGNLPL